MWHAWLNPAEPAPARIITRRPPLQDVIARGDVPVRLATQIGVLLAHHTHAAEQYIVRRGEDMPDVRNWRWPAA
jgi:hypothetical protein